jgi:hypothetical protein
MHGEVKILFKDGLPCNTRLTAEEAAATVRARYDAQDRQEIFRNMGVGNSWNEPVMPAPYQRIRYRKV